MSSQNGDFIVKNPPSKVFSGLVSPLSCCGRFSFSLTVTVTPTLSAKHFLLAAMRAFSPAVGAALPWLGLLRLDDFLTLEGLTAVTLSSSFQSLASIFFSSINFLLTSST